MESRLAGVREYKCLASSNQVKSWVVEQGLIHDALDSNVHLEEHIARNSLLIQAKCSWQEFDSAYQIKPYIRAVVYYEVYPFS